MFALLLALAVLARGTPAYAWTAPAALNANAATDSGSDSYPQVTTDGAGHWVAAWFSNDDLGGTIGTDFDILVARSADNGATWTAPAALNANAANDSGSDLAPQVTTDGAGHWVAVWYSSDDLGGTIGTDYDILVSRSIDNGATWTYPAALNTNAEQDLGGDTNPQVTTDGAGHWVAVWHSTENLGGTIGTDNDILVSRSIDNGATWTYPAALNTNAATDSGTDTCPQVTTDGAGHWVAVWYSNDDLGGTIGTDYDILVARSTTNGATWTAPAALNTNAATDSGGDYWPQVTTDGAGHWVAAWYSSDSLGGTIGTDWDILVARSADNGATWTAPAALNTNAATDSGQDYYPQVTTDGAGRWVAVLHSTDSLGGTIGTDYDILVARSTDNGATWTAPAALNTNAATDSGDDYLPQVTTDGAGHWVAVWDSTDSLGGTIGTDYDILYATEYLPGVPPAGTDYFDVQFTGHIFRVNPPYPPDPREDMGVLVATGTAQIDRGPSYWSDGRQCAHFEIVSMRLTGNVALIPVVVTAGRGLPFDVPTSTGVICEGSPESDIDLDLYIVVEVQDDPPFFLINPHNRIMSTCYCGTGTSVPPEEACLDLCPTSPNGEECSNTDTSSFPLADPEHPYENVAEVTPSEEEGTCSFLFAPVGGIAEWPGATAGSDSLADSSAGSGFNYTALGAALGAAAVALAAGAWLARRRWVR